MKNTTKMRESHTEQIMEIEQGRNRLLKFYDSYPNLFSIDLRLVCNDQEAFCYSASADRVSHFHSAIHTDLFILTCYFKIIIANNLACKS